MEELFPLMVGDILIHEGKQIRVLEVIYYHTADPEEAQRYTVETEQGIEVWKEADIRPCTLIARKGRAAYSWTTARVIGGWPA